MSRPTGYASGQLFTAAPGRDGVGHLVVHNKGRVALAAAFPTSLPPGHGDHHLDLLRHGRTLAPHD